MMISILTIILIVLGLGFFALGVIGILRFPDFFPACMLQVNVTPWLRFWLCWGSPFILCRISPLPPLWSV